MVLFVKVVASFDSENEISVVTIHKKKLQSSAFLTVWSCLFAILSQINFHFIQRVLNSGSSGIEKDKHLEWGAGLHC